MTPLLAEKWSFSPDLKTLTFSLKPNVKFQDGEPFSSKDVKFSFERFAAKDPTNKDKGFLPGSSRSTRPMPRPWCFKQQSPSTFNFLVMGPWYHGQWAGPAESLGQAEWGQDTGKFFNEKIEKPFFDHYLLGMPDPGLPKAFLFEVGRNCWKRFNTWPPLQTKPVSYFLSSDGKLGILPPESEMPCDTFVSNPFKPVPYTMSITIKHTRDYLVEDQRFSASRPDVMVYQSEPLKEDVTIAGPVKADLWVSTSGTDSDWVVKVIDVHPGDELDVLPNPRNYKNGDWQQLVRGDVMRGKFRNSYEFPEPFVPEEPTRVAWSLNDVLHTFRKGHRIMVQIQCTWFPLVDRNPQVFTNINTADASDFHQATQRIYHDKKHQSKIEFGVIPKE